MFKINNKDTRTTLLTIGNDVIGIYWLGKGYLNYQDKYGQTYSNN